MTNNFLNDDFSIAISKEFVERQLQPTIDRLLEFRRDFSNWWTTYHVRVTSVPPLEWNNGSITLIVRATAKASRAPDYDVTIRQRLTLALKPLSQRVLLTARNADLTVSLSGLGSRFLGFVKDRVRNAIIPERDAALPQAEDLINDRLTGEDGARPRINDGLKSIDDSAGAFFAAVRVTPDGLILDGSISTKNRNGPSVEFEETRDGSGFTALESWIPGGRIDRFEWSWVFQNPITVWGQQVAGTVETHRFILPKPSPPRGPLSASFSGMSVCELKESRSIPRVMRSRYREGAPVRSARPTWPGGCRRGAETMTVPVWLPEVAPDAVLNEAIAAHVNVVADRRSRITAEFPGALCRPAAGPASECPGRGIGPGPAQECAPGHSPGGASEHLQRAAAGGRGKTRLHWRMSSRPTFSLRRISTGHGTGALEAGICPQPIFSTGRAM